MRVVLELLSGPEKGRKARLAAEQSLVVGRTEWADFVTAHDARMSSKHFVLEVDPEHCHLRDLGSANGTLVNGEPATEKVLRNGDQITAGDSTFVVSIEGGAAVAEGTAIPLAGKTFSTGTAESPIQSPRAESKSIKPFTVEICNTGLQRITGVVAEMSPSELAARLTKVYPLYAIVDFNKLPGHKPPETAEAAHLFDWLPAEAAHVSPQLLRKEELAGGIPFVEKAWGNDALVLLFSRKPSAELLTHCRLSAKSNHGSVFGYCWPSVLSALLSCYRKELIDRLMTGIDAVLIEAADGPEFWEFYTKGDMAMVLSKIGLRTEAAKPQTADAS